jgi:hypothetical protein
VVGHEESVELGGFEFLDKILEMSEVEVCVREAVCEDLLAMSYRDFDGGRVYTFPAFSKLRYASLQAA